MVSDRPFSRRTVLKSAALVSSSAFIASPVSARGDIEVSVPEAYPKTGSESGNPRSPVYHTHPLQIKS